ncbi:MAG: heavy-metal-associated domain-containing protein [Terriglobia bacterium]
MNMQSKNLGLISAVLGSACCVGPALLTLLGVFSFAGGFFSRYHWEFIAAGAVGVAAAWWQFMRERRQLRAVAVRVRNEGVTRAILVFSTALIVTVFGFSFYPLLLAQRPSVSAAATTATNMEFITLPVSGMDCAICAVPIKERLHELAGVGYVDVNVPKGTVSVNYDPAKVKPEQLVATINATGYKATLPAR